MDNAEEMPPMCVKTRYYTAVTVDLRGRSPFYSFKHKIGGGEM